jgi:hypothetical protein
MNKVLVGLVAGAICGAVDGTTAWFTPQVRDQILTIVMLSTIKGVIAGVAAGLFARKVHSVPKGIAFGFVIGLLLAFAVAAGPDPKTGEHYWWQIMIPGSILGGVIGWATQRYGRPVSPRRTAAAVAVLAVALCGVDAHAHDGHDHAKKPPASVVVATHYCSGDNQPSLRRNAAKSTSDELVFDFVDVRGKNRDGHINGVTMKFGADGKVQEAWSSSGNAPLETIYLHKRR